MYPACQWGYTIEQTQLFFRDDPPTTSNSSGCFWVLWSGCCFDIFSTAIHMEIRDSGDIVVPVAF